MKTYHTFPCPYLGTKATAESTMVLWLACGIFEEQHTGPMKPNRFTRDDQAKPSDEQDNSFPDAGRLQKNDEQAEDEIAGVVKATLETDIAEQE